MSIHANPIKQHDRSWWLYLASFAFCLFWAMAAAAEVDSAHIIGTAYPLDSSTPAYSEHHYFDERQNHRVDFVSPNGRVFATKSINYVTPRYQPNFTHFDSRHDLRYGSKAIANGIEIFSEKKSSRRKTKYLKANTNTVIDAGFVPYIQSHWSDILTQEHRINFVLAKRLSTIKLIISSVNPEASPLHQKTGSDNWFYFKCKAANSVVGWFMKPIHLAFDGEKQLKIFQGLSNINDDKNKAQHVTIHYQYNL